MTDAYLPKFLLPKTICIDKQKITKHIRIKKHTLPEENKQASEPNSYITHVGKIAQGILDNYD